MEIAEPSGADDLKAGGGGRCEGRWSKRRSGCIDEAIGYVEAC